MLEAVESKVLKLVRIAIGPVRIGDLPIGKWRHLNAGRGTCPTRQSLVEGNRRQAGGPRKRRAGLVLCRRRLKAGGSQDWLPPRILVGIPSGDRGRRRPSCHDRNSRPWGMCGRRRLLRPARNSKCPARYAMVASLSTRLKR